MSELRFELKKTSELSIEEASAIVVLFKDVMDHERTVDEFYCQFLNTPLGYSFHVLMYEDGILVGSHSNIPSFYFVDGQRMLFVTGCDTMIKKKHRDIFNYMEMLSFNKNEMKKNGVIANFGYPNDYNYKILTKGKLARTIGHMNIYCLPYRIGGIKESMKWLNWASMLFSYLWLFISSVFASKKIFHFRIEKDVHSFNKSRYKRNISGYSVRDGFAYKIIEYEGVRTAFLIDVFAKSPKNFCNAIKLILKNDRNNLDLILYPGYLPFSITGMIKIPHRFEPKHFHMTGNIYDKSGIDESVVFDINNWDTNMSNYDLI